MATVKGPLHSAAARGTIGNCLTIQGQRSRHIARLKPTPAGSPTASQLAIRNAYAVAMAGVLWASRTPMMQELKPDTDRRMLMLAAPSTHTWAMWLSAQILGTGHTHFDFATGEWQALDPADWDAWDIAARDLSPPFLPVAQAPADEFAPTSMQAGEVFFHYCVGLWAAGLMTDRPGPVPPVYL